MPTYQYSCTGCDERLEVVQKFTDEPLTECPACHGRLRKVFSPVGVVFKGSGFYRTDSRAGAGAKSGAKTEAASTSASGDGSGSSTEKKATGGRGTKAPAKGGDSKVA